jgi:hypothetical protein
MLWRRSSGLRGNGGWRRRSRPPRADSVEGEEESGEGNLQGTPGKLGEEQNSGGRRRPWRQCRACAGKRSRGGEEHAGEGGEGGQQQGNLSPRRSAALIQAGGCGAVASGGHGRDTEQLLD